MKENIEKNDYKYTIKCIIKQILVILLYFVINISLALLLYKWLMSNNKLILNISYFIIEIVTLIIFIFIFRKTLFKEFKDYKKNYRTYIDKTIIYYIIGLAIMVFSNLIISLFLTLPTNEALNRSILDTLPVYAIFSMVISAPIVEESMTRILLKDAFKNKWIYIILSGLIFGSLHMLSIKSPLELLYIIPYSSLGCVFAKMYNDTNCLWTNITYHSFHNLVSVILLLI